MLVAVKSIRRSLRLALNQMRDASRRGHSSRRWAAPSSDGSEDAEPRLAYTLKEAGHLRRAGNRGSGILHGNKRKALSMA